MSAFGLSHKTSNAKSSTRSKTEISHACCIDAGMLAHGVLHKVSVTESSSEEQDQVSLEMIGER